MTVNRHEMMPTASLNEICLYCTYKTCVARKIRTAHFMLYHFIRKRRISFTEGKFHFGHEKAYLEASSIATVTATVIEVTEG